MAARFFMFSLVVLLPGCGVPEPKRVGGIELNLPATWIRARADNEGEVIAGWLRELEDPELERRVAEALDHNHDLRAAAARLRLAEEETILGRAARLPWLTASGSASYGESRFTDASGDLRPFIDVRDARLSLDA